MKYLVVELNYILNIFHRFQYPIKLKRQRAVEFRFLDRLYQYFIYLEISL